MSGPSGEHVTEWAGGSLAELMSVLSAAALPSRIRVFAPGAGEVQVGEVHLLAGGINDAFAGDKRGQEAVSALQQVNGARFVIDTRLPDPETGSLTKPGPGEGNLAQRPLVEVMRYCEDYVLTCTLEVWRGEEQARISYRRGELVGTSVGGSDAPERLPEVMAWKEGFFEIDLPLPVTPPVPAPSRRSSGMAAVVGDSPAARPAAAEHPRRETDPFISLGAIKKNAPPRPAPARPEGAPKLPRVPSLPGFKSRPTPPIGSRVTPPAPALPAGVVPSSVVPPIGSRVIPPGPVPSPAAAQPRGGSLPSMPAARSLQSPGAAQAKPSMPAPRPLSTAGIPAKLGGVTPAVGSPVPAPGKREVVSTAPAVPTNPPTARASTTARLPHTPSPSAPTAPAQESRAAAPLAPVPWPAAKPSVAQPPAQPASAPAVEPAAAPPLAEPSAQPASAPTVEAADTSAVPVQDAAETQPPAPSASPLPDTLPVAVQHRAPVHQPTPAPVLPESAAASQSADLAAIPPAEPVASPSSGSTRRVSPAAGEATPSPANRLAGETRRPSKSHYRPDERPFGVELPEDMQDPAALVNTPAPHSPAMARFDGPATSTPVSPTPEPAEVPTVRLAPIAPGRPDELGLDFEDSRARSGKRAARRGPGDWPWVVHVLIGIALGAAVVVGYSVYYGLPLP
jgi:hypothetical protein